jgi:cob(I)alamin adenosyltransferase
MKIYTKTGDAGETGLLDGSRVAKDHVRVAACGDVDELNAVLGVVKTQVDDKGLSKLLTGVQRDLFALGAQLADPKQRIAKRKAKAAISASRVRALEKTIDRHDAELTPLRAFILPGGSRAGAFLHLARTICRRAERSLVHLSRDAHLEAVLIVYLNRLSDLLFVLARRVNQRLEQPEDRW